MFKLLATVVFILAIVLFPPAILAYVSQDALPGDSLYPVKRKLEDGVLFLASITPQTKAWYALAYSQRRYKETTGLIAKGENKAAGGSLKELVSQTSLAASDIQHVSDLTQKKALIQDLAKSLAEYNKGLTDAKEQLGQPKGQVQPTPAASPTPKVSVSATPKAIGSPKPSPSVSPISIPTPLPTATPAPSISDEDAELQKQIDDALAELDKIRAEIDSELNDSSSASELSSPSSLSQTSQQIDQVNVDGLEDISNQTFQQYYKILP